MKAADIVFKTPTPAQFPLYDAERKKTMATVLAQGLVTQKIIDRLTEFQAYVPMPSREIGHEAVERILQIHGIGISVEGNDALCSLIGVPDWADEELAMFEAELQKQADYKKAKAAEREKMLAAFGDILQHTKDSMKLGPDIACGQNAGGDLVRFDTLLVGAKFIVFRYGQPVTFVKGVHEPFYGKTVLGTDTVIHLV